MTDNQIVSSIKNLSFFCRPIQKGQGGDKVLEALQPSHNLSTTLSQPCKTLQQPCHNLATTLSKPCSIFTIPLQPCSHIVYSFTRLSQACHNLATNSVVYSQSHCNLAATLSIPSQGCNKVVTTLPQTL